MKTRQIFQWIGLGLMLLLVGLGAERLFGGLRFGGGASPTSTVEGPYIKRGGVYERLDGDAYGDRIPWAKMTWVHEGGKTVAAVVDASGNYTVQLPELGQYYVTVSHPGFEKFTTVRGTAYAVEFAGSSVANFSIRRLPSDEK